MSFQKFAVAGGLCGLGAFLIYVADEPLARRGAITPSVRLSFNYWFSNRIELTPERRKIVTKGLGVAFIGFGVLSLLQSP